LAVNWGCFVRGRLAVTLGLNKRHALLEQANCQRISLDSRESVVLKIEKANASIVIHTSGLTNVDTCEASISDAHYAKQRLQEMWLWHAPS
jgi:hypothetical protein